MVMPTGFADRLDSVGVGERKRVLMGSRRSLGLLACVPERTEWTLGGASVETGLQRAVGTGPPKDVKWQFRGSFLQRSTLALGGQASPEGN